MKITIVGGSKDKISSIISKFVYNLGSVLQNSKLSYGIDTYNGDIPENIKGSDLTIWIPDIPNEEPKNYPVKDKGSVLICSKVIHGDRTEVDAISRIFSMHGNAVICIYKDKPKFRFKLIDALGNVWIETDDIKSLCNTIIDFYKWSDSQIRMSLKREDCLQCSLPISTILSEEFIELNTKVANSVENSLGSRYFGNFSTRCMKLFPNIKLTDDYYLFSPRNTDKKRLTKEDFVLVKKESDSYIYYGSRKPSVDTPIQLKLYEKYKDINFMIHGHAFIEYGNFINEWYTTKNYFPCGDLREVDEISKILDKGYRYLNIKNHGFLIVAEDLERMKNYISEIEFKVNDFLRKDINERERII